jgi:hypothetical protein
MIAPTTALDGVVVVVVVVVVVSAVREKAPAPVDYPEHWEM